ncbi:MAG TPA: hypothetical protein VLA34_11215, partial [Candidatus Krumholzibacterium sp.]|nr:hypothetical protein [Candidatus Krumholzibacterium sp.]
AVVVSCAALVTVSVAGTEARKIDRAGLRIRQALDENENPVFIEQGIRDLQTSAAVDTYCLVWYDFEQKDWQGWTQVDNTAQIDTFWHVDDFSGLGGGTYGGLVPLEGARSLWCGTRPAGDPLAKAAHIYLCSWESAPGYGNKWSQSFEIARSNYTGYVDISYKIRCDTENDYDKVIFGSFGYFEETVVAEYTGRVEGTFSHRIYDPRIYTKMRFHFSSDAVWSDQDGLWDSDGACIVDSITVGDLNGLIDFEDFEWEDVGALETDSGVWKATVDSEYEFGIYSGLANNLYEDDPCGENPGTQIAFFFGSVIPAPDYPWPGLYSTPFCKGAGGIEAPCQDEMVVSPVIDLAWYSSGRNENQDTPIPPASLPDMGGLILRYSTYYDLPMDNLVFDTWGVRSIDGYGCPGAWRDSGFRYYINHDSYIQNFADISTLVDGDYIQVSLGVVDMCDSWFDSYGDCAEHTPSPWYDNVRLYRYDSSGPQWSSRDLDLFQDNFPSEEWDIESWVRIDAANDLRPNDDPMIDPGDSAVVGCTAQAAGGLDTLVTGEERVYCHVWAEYIGRDGYKADLFGPSLEGTYGTYVSDDGSQWTVFLMPRAVSASGHVSEDVFMIDLNDSLFTRGYEIKYYFRAYDLAGNTSTLPANAGAGGWMYEVTCLPTRNSEILFVDDFHGRGTDDGIVQTYWDTFLDCIWPAGPDRYDVNSPSSLGSNGPGSRAKWYHMTDSYEMVFWDSGNLSSGTITEGTSWSDKSNDAQMLIDWLDLSEHKVGLWIMGDDVAADLDGAPSAPALALMSTYCGVSLVDDSYFHLTGGLDAGGIPNPQVTGVAGGIYEGIDYYAFGGCPVLNSFDVLETAGASSYSLRLPDYNSTAYYIGIFKNDLNCCAYPMRTSWIGHSMMYVRDGEDSWQERMNLFHETII